MIECKPAQSWRPCWHFLKLSQWQTTLRYPTSEYPNATSQNNLVAQQLDNSAASFRDRLYNLFTNYPNYTTFSNEAWIPDNNTEGYDSIESIHDQIHGLTGSGGHMTYIDYSGFDPIFWVRTFFLCKWSKSNDISIWWFMPNSIVFSSTMPW